MGSASLILLSELLQSAGLIERAWDIIEQFFPLDPGEGGYVSGINRGELLPHMLFAPGYVKHLC